MKKRNCWALFLITVLASLGPSVTAATADSITLSLDEAVAIALSENPTVIVSDMEIKRTDYARRETIGGLFPTVDKTIY